MEAIRCRRYHLSLQIAPFLEDNGRRAVVRTCSCLNTFFGSPLQLKSWGEQFLGLTLYCLGRPFQWQTKHVPGRLFLSQAVRTNMASVLKGHIVSCLSRKGGSNNASFAAGQELVCPGTCFLLRRGNMHVHNNMSVSLDCGSPNMAAFLVASP